MLSGCEGGGGFRIWELRGCHGNSVAITLLVTRKRERPRGKYISLLMDNSTILDFETKELTISPAVLRNVFLPVWAPKCNTHTHTHKHTLAGSHKVHTSTCTHFTHHVHFNRYTPPELQAVGEWLRRTDSLGLLPGRGFQHSAVSPCTVCVCVCVDSVCVDGRGVEAGKEERREGGGKGRRREKSQRRARGLSLLWQAKTAAVLKLQCSATVPWGCVFMPV